jgi:hypothetical protein
MSTELERLVAKEAITIESTPSSTTPSAPSMKDMTGHTCVLKYRGRRLTTPFFTQRGYEPAAADVIYALCREAASLDGTNGNFEAWAKKHRMNPDSRSAYAVWEGIAKSSPRFKKFLGRRYKDFSGASHR